MQNDDIFLKNLAGLIEKKCGIPFTQEKISLYLSSIFHTSTLVSKMGYVDYLNLLENSNIVEDNEWKNVIKSLNISETYFFRDSSQLNFLQSILLPQLIRERNTESRLSFWSAGCSTGEEAYTLGFILDSLLRDGSVPFRIIGSDFNINSIQFARQARYFSWSLRALPESKKTLYFQEDSDIWEVKAAYRKMIEFRIENLLKIEYTGEFDFIICRNVFIYLNEETKQTILEKFATALKPGGYLILGHSEAGLVIPKTLKVNNQSSFVYYSKFPGHESKSITHFEPKEILVDKELFNKSIRPKSSLQDVVHLANLGKLTEAKEICLSLLSKNEDNHEALYWLGHILEAEGDYLSAEAQYTKSLKLQQDFLETYISLSSLYTVLGRDRESEFLKKQCLHLLAERQDLHSIYERKGLDMKKLLRYLETKKEIWVA